MTLGPKIRLVGLDSSCLTDEIKKELGELMALLLYHQIDKASSILLTMTEEDYRTLGIAAQKLGELCKVCKDDIRAI